MWNGEALPTQEDFVEYHIYGIKELCIEELLELKIIYTNYLKQFIKEYIWQRDQFNLSIVNDTQLHLNGLTRFGDNIEDEWFIVYLLLELSKRFEDIIISVTDNEGQFLLIEAALDIPKWLKPENSTNRVWIWSGLIHIIPNPTTPLELIHIPSGNALTVSKALSILKEKLTNTVSNEKVQETIERRAREAAEKARKSSHYTRCYLPDTIAYILYHQPQLIAKAVECYYYRDTIQMRVCRKMTKFPSNSSSYHIIRFTRFLYAQLLRQKLDFIPNGYRTLPPDSPNTASEFKSISLGHKLACGFEILYSEEQKINGKKNSDEPNWAVIIDDILQSAYGNYLIPVIRSNPDPDDWLNISPEEVNDIILQKQRELEKYFNKNRKKKSHSSTNNKTEEKNKPNYNNSKENTTEKDKIDIVPDEMAPEDNIFDFMVKDMKKFFSKVSDMEGISDNEGSSNDEDDDFYDFENGDFGIKDNEFKEIIEKMDEELNKTTMGQSFESVVDGNTVDVNLNLVKNFMYSYEAQQGSSGPVTNILSKT